MSGMDRLTDSELEAMLGYDLHDARGELCRTSDYEDQSWGMSILACSIADTDAVVKAMARELLAHRRASQAAPGPSDGLREALLREVLDCQEQHYGDGMRLHVAMISLADRIRAALTPAPAQEGGA